MYYQFSDKSGFITQQRMQLAAHPAFPAPLSFVHNLLVYGALVFA